MFFPFSLTVITIMKFSYIYTLAMSSSQNGLSWTISSKSAFLRSWRFSFSSTILLFKLKNCPNRLVLTHKYWNMLLKFIMDNCTHHYHQIVPQFFGIHCFGTLGSWTFEFFSILGILIPPYSLCNHGLGWNSTSAPILIVVPSPQPSTFANSNFWHLVI